MIIDSPIISGSYAATGSLNQVGDVTITGSLRVTGAIIGAVTGSIDSASFAQTAVSSSYAVSASQTQNALTASFVANAQTASYVLNAVSASRAVSAASSAQSSTVSISGISTNANFVFPLIATGSGPSFGLNTGTTVGFTYNPSSSLFTINNLRATGSLLGTASFASNALTASYAVNTSFLNGLGSDEFVPTGSFNTFSSSILTYTGSNNTNISNIHSTTASLNTFTGSANSRLSSLETTSGSNITRISALELASGSAITRLNSIESTTGSLNSYTASNDATVTSVAAAAVSAVAGVNALASKTGSYTLTSSFNSYTASNDTTMSCVSSTATSAIAGVGALASKTGSYATTGSNTFVEGQYISASYNPTGFTTTASLYTDGGLRVGRDAYISGTLYLNNVTVYGTQSISYISSSQLNIGTNIISVNTDTPSVRFGGLAVYDSGSTGLTGSILWDSQNNHWVYSNPSGSSYSGGMFISGPRTATLGSETGTTACMLLAGQGGDHLTSSMIYHDSNATCFYGNSRIDSSGNSCQAGYAVVNNCLGIGTASPSVYGVDAYNASNSVYFKATSNATIAYYGAATALGTGVAGTFSNHDLALYTNSSEKVRITAAGVACFSNTVCAPTVLSSGTVCATGNTCFGGMSIVTSCLGIGTATPSAILHVSQPSANTVFRLGNNTTYDQFIYFNGNNDWSLGMDYSNSNAFVLSNSSTIGTSDRVVVTTGGNVGIGTTSPFGKLSVDVTAAAPSLSGNMANGLIVHNTSFGRAIQLGVNESGAYNYIQSSYVNNADVGVNLAFFIGATERMRITNAGVACFAGTTCIPTLMLGASVAANFRLNVSGHYSAETASWPTDGSGDCYRSGIGWQSTANPSLVLSSFITTINDGNYGGHIIFLNRGTNGGNLNERFRITSGGIACFQNTVCAPNYYLTSNTGLILFGSDGAVNPYLQPDSSNNLYLGTSNGYRLLIPADGGCMVFRTSCSTGNPQVRLTISCTGIACFACQVCVGGNIAAIGYGNRIYIGDVDTNRLDVLGGSGLGRLFNGSATVIQSNGCVILDTIGSTRLIIASTGIATFSCQVCMPATAVISGGGNTLILKKGTGSPAIALAGTSDEAAFLVEGVSGGGMKWYTSPAGCTLSNAAWSAKFNMDVSGISTFSCTVCAPIGIFSTCVGINVTSPDAPLRIHGGAGSTSTVIIAGGAAGNDNATISAPYSMVFQVDNTGGVGGRSFSFKCGGKGYSDGTTLFAISPTGNVTPGANGTQDLGSSSLRWCTVYTSDLSLNNGIGNYTIVEGENDLFLYNNNSCKVYKFVVQEVCPEIAPAKRSI